MPRSHIPGGGPICGALKKNGEPCKQREVPGTGRCYLHGGATPVAKIKAEQALAAMRFPAIEALQQIVQTLTDQIEQLNSDVCTACGFPKGDIDDKEAITRACTSAAKTCAMILDRTGLGPRATLEVKQSDGDLDLNLLTESERSRMMEVLTTFESIKEEVRTRLNGLAGLPAPPTAHTVQ